jgi:hypothetical protein
MGVILRSVDGEGEQPQTAPGQLWVCSRIVVGARFNIPHFLGLSFWSGSIETEAYVRLPSTTSAAVEVAVCSMEETYVGLARKPSAAGLRVQ